MLLDPSGVDGGTESSQALAIERVPPLCATPISAHQVRLAKHLQVMGAGGLTLPQGVPVFPGRRDLDRDQEDPAGKPVEAVRPIVDEIDRRVQAPMAELLPPALW